MMKQSVPLSDWTRPPPMERTAPWQQALSPREKQPYPSIPPPTACTHKTHTQTHILIELSVFTNVLTHLVFTQTLTRRYYTAAVAHLQLHTSDP